MTTCSTHVLDAALGQPAAELTVQLTTGSGTPIATGVTDDDGRVRFEADLDAHAGHGHHRLIFATGAWFAAQQRDTFFPEVTVSFTVTEGEHHHVAVLLSPFAHTTYRGS